MPLPQAALDEVARAKAANPDVYGPLSPEASLTRMLDKNPGERDTLLARWGMSDADTNWGVGGYASGFVKGLGDSINPTTYDIPETVGDSPWSRIAGEVVGSLGTMGVAPWLRGAGLIAKAGKAAQLTKYGDVAARTGLGLASGVRDVDRMAIAGGREEGDPWARTVGGLGGAVMAGGPLDFHKDAIKNALLTGGTILGGAGIQGGAMGMEAQRGFIPGAAAAMTSLPALGFALGGGTVAGMFPGRMRFSALDPAEEAAGPTVARAAAEARAAGAPQGTTTSVLGGSKVPGSNIPPPPSAYPLDETTEAAIQGALSAEGRAGIEGLEHVSIDDAAAEAQEKELTKFDLVRQLQESVRQAKEKASGRALRGSVYAAPIEGVSEGFERIEGTTSWDALIKGNLVSKQDLRGKVERIMVLKEPDGLQRRLVLPPGTAELTQGLSKGDVLPEEVALKMKIPREVRVFGRKVPVKVPEGTEQPPGEYLFYSVADPSPTPKIYSLPEMYLPTIQGENIAFSKRNKEEAGNIGKAKIAAQSAIRSPGYRPADMDELIKVLLADLQELGIHGKPDIELPQ